MKKTSKPRRKPRRPWWFVLERIGACCAGMEFAKKHPTAQSAWKKCPSSCWMYHVMMHVTKSNPYSNERRRFIKLMLILTQKRRKRLLKVLRPATDALLKALWKWVRGGRWDSDTINDLKWNVEVYINEINLDLVENQYYRAAADAIYICNSVSEHHNNIVMDLRDMAEDYYRHNDRAIRYMIRRHFPNPPKYKKRKASQQ